MGSFYDQILQLKIIPTHQGQRFMANKVEIEQAERRAAEWKSLTDRLRDLDIALVQEELSNKDEHRISILEMEISKLEMLRNALKAKYWSKGENDAT